MKSQPDGILLAHHLTGKCLGHYHFIISKETDVTIYMFKRITGEIGTYVNIKVKKANGEIKEYTLERREVIVPSIASTELEGNIGYILINSFTNNTATEVEKIAADFKSRNIEK